MHLIFYNVNLEGTDGTRTPQQSISLVRYSSAEAAQLAVYRACTDWLRKINSELGSKSELACDVIRLECALQAEGLAKRRSPKKLVSVSETKLVVVNSDSQKVSAK